MALFRLLLIPVFILGICSGCKPNLKQQAFPDGPKGVRDAMARQSIVYRWAEKAGLSRVLGGYHIQADNVEGLTLGHKVGQEVWKWFNTHIGARQ